MNKKCRRPGVLLLTSGLLALALQGCGSSQQPEVVTLNTGSGTDTTRTTSSSQNSQSGQTAAKSTAVASEAGRYAEFITKTPLLPGLVPYDPKLLFYGLHVNCSGCHDWVYKLDQVKARLKKVKRTGSIQDMITMGRMPPSKPKFASSPEGAEMLQLLNGL